MKTVHEYTYTTRQLNLRDELVLKSIVRILNGQTQHVWHYDASHQADVLLLGTQTTFHESMNGAELAQHPLAVRVGGSTSGQSHLSLPLRVGDVLVALNHAGDVLAHLKDKLNEQAAGAGSHPVEAVIALVRWPAWNVLQQDSRYLRVATVLATGPSTISELSAKSGVTFDTCDCLIRLLQSQDLIETMIDTKPAADNPAGSWLELAPAAPTREPSAAQVLPTKKDSSTLWCRIRRRLGLDIVHAS